MSDTSAPLEEVTSDDPLLAWRRRTTLLVLRIITLFATPLLLFDALNQLRYERWFILGWNLTTLTLCIALAFIPRLSYKLRARALIAIFLLGSLLGVRYFGLFGVVYLSAIVSIVFAVLLLGARAGVVTIVLLGLGLGLIFSGFAGGWLPYPYQFFDVVIEPWVLFNHWLLVLGSAVAMALIISSLVRSLQASLQAGVAARADLEHLNASLESTIEQRTAEMRRTAGLLSAAEHAAQVGACAYNPLSNTLIWTDELYRIHEVLPGTKIDALLMERLYPGESWRTLTGAFERLVGDGTPYQMDLPALTLNGRSIWVRVNAFMANTAGEPNYVGAVQDITAFKLAEQQAAMRLRYAEALAACSRVLLSPASSKDAFQQVLSDTLAIVREAIIADRITMARYPHLLAGEGEMPRGYQVMARSVVPDAPPLRPPTLEELRDMPDALNVWRRGGGEYNGPIAGLLIGHPHFRRYCQDNSIKSVLIEALRFGNRWWGHIDVADYHQERHWDSDAVKFLQTAAEMLVTYIEGWEASHALQEREALLRSVNETLPDGFIYQLIQRPDASYDRFTYISPSIERMLGVPASEVLRNPAALWPTVHPDDLSLLMQADLDSVQQRAPFDVALRLIKADGQIGWFHIRSVMTQELDGGRMIWNGMALEISALKHAELALAKQLRYAEALARCSQVLLADEAASMNWVEAVQQALEALRSAVGCRRVALRFYQSPDEILDLPNLVIAAQDPSSGPRVELPVNKADVPQLILEMLADNKWIAGSIDELFPDRNSIRTHLETNESRSLLFMGFQMAGLWRGYLAVTDADEAWIWSESMVALFRTGLDMIAAFIHQWETTAMLRTREALLYASQARQESLLQAIPDLLLGVSTAGEIRFVHTPPAAPMTLPSTVLGRQVAAVLPPELKAVVADALAEPTAERQMVHLCNGNNPDGAITLEVRLVAMGFDERLIIVRDVTAQQRLNDALAHARDAAEAAAQAKSTFLATMSHEIRTPLNAVIGMTTLLQETELSDIQRSYVATINSGGQALLAVINDILDFSRIEAGHMELESAPFDLHACLHSAVDLVAHETMRKGLFLTCTLDADVPQAVIGDASRLRQVLLNLLGNAVKFTDSGSIKLQAVVETHTDQTTRVTIMVRDTGIGMEPGQVQRIFEPFIQGDSSISRRFGGTGLGLAISRQLVALMGGELAVESTPGNGSTFSITIPFVLTADPILRRPAEVLDQADVPLRVLVAEDNPINQEVIRQLLEHMGHTVTVVADGRAAVEAVGIMRYDAVLMDVQMPVLDGATAARQIRHLGRTIVQPVIVALTANAMAEDRARFLQNGMDAYLSKPVQPEALQQVLAQVAGSATEFQAEATPPPMPEEVPPLIDWDEVAHLQQAMNLEQAGVLAMMLRIFEHAIPPQLDAIDLAIDAGDSEQWRLAAHRLRGGCLQIGAAAMAEWCRRLEQTGNNLDCPDLIAELHTCYSQTYALLRDPLSSSGR